MIPEVELAVAERAAGEHLDGVDRARVRLHRHDQIVPAPIGAQDPQCHLRGAQAEGQPGAHVPMEPCRLLEHPFIHQASPKDRSTGTTRSGLETVDGPEGRGSRRGEKV